MVLSNQHTAEKAGVYASALTAEYLNRCIKKQGYARIVLSTGASQFPLFDKLIYENVDWSKVEMFHLDEYIGIDETHEASFKKYLLERFVNRVKLNKAYFVNGMGEPSLTIEELTNQIRSKPIDLGLIGIGENAHIAFNDPPADFNSKEAYKVVDLNETCKRQQVNEGWFKDETCVCKQAISMTCFQILQCKKIISLVPYAIKATAIQQTITSDITPDIPATILKTHKDCTIIGDDESFSLINESLFDSYSKVV